MDAILDGRGGRLDLLVRSGADMPTVLLEFSNDDGTPLDLTGATTVARAATRADSPETMTISAVITDAPNGAVTLDFASAEIDKMAAPSNVGVRPRAAGDWTLDMVTSGGRVLPMTFGEILVAAKTWGAP